jgi:putative tricarboxylic transport membrane protein
VVNFDPRNASQHCGGTLLQQKPERVWRIRAPRDFFGGLALIVIALVAIWAGRDLGGMSGFAFGPGTAPRLFAGLLALCGAGIAVSGLLVDGPAVEPFAIRGPLFVLIAILGFAALIRPLGLVAATYVTFLVSIFGSREFRIVESVIAGAAMTAFCVLLFVYLLELPFDLWPNFF